MTDIVTADLSKFGYRELALAGELLNAYAEYGAEFMGDGLTLNFNANSGKVFLSDEDFNVAVVENERIVQFYSCSQCGNEGTQEEGKAEGWDFEKFNGYCSEECENKNK